MDASQGRTRRLIALGCSAAGLLTSYVCAAAPARTAADQTRADVPAWVYPLSPPTTLVPATYDQVKPIHIPDSGVTFTEAQLNDFFAAPDWHPEAHSLMPEVVSHGRPPDVFACGFCHSPGGQGRPENASLAGLPAQYIVQQMADFKSGARRKACSFPYRPSDFMVREAAQTTDEEVAAAAQYFSVQHLQSRVIVIERAKVPKMHVVGWVYAADGGITEEPLGERLLELAPDVRLHESRVDTMRYIAYVPPGSISRGSAIAHSGMGPSTPGCVSCHGENLHGVGLTPPLAGRSPTYILRQLLAFKTGARSGAAGQPMRGVVANLQMGDMIDAAAYAASLTP